MELAPETIQVLELGGQVVGLVLAVFVILAGLVDLMARTFDWGS